MNRRSPPPLQFADLELSPAFTDLDRLLLRAIRDSTLGISGSALEQELERVISEVQGLNAERQQTFFHRGYYDSIFKPGEPLTSYSRDYDSKMWYVAGRITGCLLQMPSRCINLLESDRDACDELFRDTNPLRLQLLLHGIYPVLRDGGLLERAVTFLRVGVRSLADERQLQLASNIVDDAADLLRSGDVAAALLLLDTVPEFDPSTADAAGALGRRIERKKAQTLLAAGQQHAAETRLRKLAQLVDFDESLDALADLGLSAAGLRILYSATPAKTTEEQKSLADALERGRHYFEQAVNLCADGDPARAKNAHFALGVLQMIRGPDSASVAVGHLRLALAGMLKEPTSYAHGNLIDWTRFLLGLCTLELCEPTQLRAAATLMEDALRSPVLFPASLWSRSLVAAAVFDDKSLAVQMASALLRTRGAESFDLIKGSGALEKGAGLRSLYVESLDPERRSVQQLADDWELILRLALAEQQVDLASEMLDQLEGLAHRWDGYAERFLRLLDAAEMYSPAWQPSDADEARLSLLEARGRFDEATPLLQSLFWKRLGDKSYDAQAQLPGIVDHLREIRAAPDAITLLESHLPVDEPPVDSGESVDELAKGARVVVLFVGGDERQSQHDAAIIEKVLRSAPGVTLEFVHPGWGSQWKPICDRIKIRLRDYDAIVLSPLVRTNMGRCIRAVADEQTPWFACPARGPEFISRTVIHAARRALQIRRAAPKI